jgi:hypothetical protein
MPINLSGILDLCKELHAALEDDDEAAIRSAHEKLLNPLRPFYDQNRDALAAVSEPKRSALVELALNVWGCGDPSFGLGRSILRRLTSELLSSSGEYEQDAFDRLTPRQEKLVGYLRSCRDKKASIRDAMRKMGKQPASNRDRKSFLAAVRRLNARLEVYHPDLEIELDRVGKTIQLSQR